MEFFAAPHLKATRSNWSDGLFEWCRTLTATICSVFKHAHSLLNPTHFNVAIHAVAREGEGVAGEKSAFLGRNRLRLERHAPSPVLGAERFEGGLRPLR
jgi:hypothetical protein